MAKNLKDLLQAIIPENAAWKIKLLNEWPTIVGHLHQHVKVQKIYADALVLGVTDSSWLQEMYLLSGVLIETINKNLDKPRINRLHFKNIGDMEYQQPALAPKPKEVIAPEPIPNKQHLTRQQQKTLDRVEDPELRAVLKELLFVCYQKDTL